MAEYEPALQKALRREGGMTLNTLEGDSGGRTFAGISWNNHPNWEGWSIIDAGRLNDARLTPMVREFYRIHYWNEIRGDEIESQLIAESIFDYAVNAGVGTAVRLAQILVGTTPDGDMGPKTLAALNGMTAITVTADSVFDERYFVAKVARGLGLGRRKKSQRAFYQSWFDRALESVQ